MIGKGILRAHWLLLFGALMAQNAIAGQIEDVLNTPLSHDEGILLVSVDTEVPFEGLHLKSSSRVFDSVVAENVKPGKSLYLVILPIGHYQWRSIDIGGADFYRGKLDLDKNSSEKYEFDIRPGKINYPGDFIIQTQYGSALTKAMAEQKLSMSSFLFTLTYYTELRDRFATVLANLTPEQVKAFNRIGYLYVGPGNDMFPEYYVNLAAQ